MPETIISKTCSRCQRILPVTDFYKQKSAKDGVRSQCKMCRREYEQTTARKASKRKQNQSAAAKAALKQYEESDKGRAVRRSYRQSERGRRYRQTEAGKTTACKASAKHRNLNPEKGKAGHFVNHAIDAGRMPSVKTLKCAHCPKQAEEYHHYKGYARKHWLDVVPLCRLCHRKTHNPNSCLPLLCAVP